MLGERSYMRHLSLKSTIEKEELVLSKVQSNRYLVEKKVKMMRPGSVNMDFLTERVRSVLGYKFVDEIVIFSSHG